MARRYTSHGAPAPVEIWHRQHDEPNKAYTAFQLYLKLGPGRSLDRASYFWTHKAELPKDLKYRASGRFTGWCQKFSWTERAKAYDDRLKREEIQRQFRLERDDAREWAKTLVANRRFLNDLKDLVLQRATEILAMPLYDETVEVTKEDGTIVRTITKAPKVSVGDASKMLEVALKIEGRILGEVMPLIQEVRQEMKDDLTERDRAAEVEAEAMLEEWRTQKLALVDSQSDTPPDDEEADGGGPPEECVA